MPALNKLTPEERDFFCDTLDHVLSEENSDRLIALVKYRVKQLEDRHLGFLGRVARWIPGLPNPTDIVVKKLDRLLPEAIRDPLKDLVSCP